jgi:hypothetical protein
MNTGLAGIGSMGGILARALGASRALAVENVWAANRSVTHPSECKSRYTWAMDQQRTSARECRGSRPGTSRANHFSMKFRSSNHRFGHKPQYDVRHEHPAPRKAVFAFENGGDMHSFVFSSNVADTFGRFITFKDVRFLSSITSR